MTLILRRYYFSLHTISNESQFQWRELMISAALSELKKSISENNHRSLTMVSIRRKKPDDDDDELCENGGK